MDRHGFDALARALSGTVSRRETVAVLLAGLLGSGSLSPASEPAAARKRQHKKKRNTQKQRRNKRHVAVEGPCGNGSGKSNRCKKDRDCCTRHCDRKKGRCRCLKAGQACTNDRLCCPGRTGRTCQDGTCQPALPCDGDVCASGCPESSLQAAIDAASDGATIRLCAETYGGNFTIDKDLTLLGAGDGEDGTVLDGEESGTVFTVASDVAVTLQGLRVTGGNASQLGGGIANSGDLTLTACTVTGNVAGFGGGIYSSSEGTVTMTDISVTDNRAANNGGGIWSQGGAITLTNCSVMDNTTRDGGGGILNNDGGTLNLTDSTVSDNVVSVGSGGGIANGGSGSEVTLNGASRVADNEAALQGGGIYNADDGIVTLNDSSSVTDNTTNGDGGGILNDNGTVILNDSSSIRDNEAGSDGGGIYNDAAFGNGTSTCNGGSSVSGNTPNDCVAVGGGSCEGC